MTNGLDDVMIVLEFLTAQKTLTGRVLSAMERLRTRQQDRTPFDIAYGDAVKVTRRPVINSDGDVEG
jgi:hypothetical protein